MSQIESFSKTKFGVLAIGSVAASLILWLSVSFWIDAWRQHEDARELRRVAALESALVDIARDVAAERAGTLVLLGEPILREDSIDATTSLARLRGRRERLDERLGAALVAVEATIDDPALVGRLRQSAVASRTALTAVEETRRALAGQQAASARLLADEVSADGAPASPVAREIALQRTFVLGSRLVERLHVLQDGLTLELRTNVRAIADLRRLKRDLRDLDESAARAAALSNVLASPYVALDDRRAGTWAVTPAAARARVDSGLERLRLRARERAIAPALLDELHGLVAAYERAAVTARGGDAARERVTRLDAAIERAIAAEARAVEAHARRRLLIDTALILVCGWIVVASLRLLRNVQHQAWHDRLTGLPNRFRFERLLEGALAQRREHGGRLAVVALDVDGFKSVNESVGHGLGDELLQRLAERLSAELGADGTLVALGGDEFAVVATTIASEDDTLALAERLRRAGERPFEVGGASLRVTLSLGVAVAGEDVTDADEDTAAGLLQCAGIAMRQAKDDGRNRVRRFCPALAERNRERVRLEIDLRRAVAEAQLELHYQPKIGTRSHRVDGLEALVRWRHPERGLVPPGRFVPIAESAGLIGAIGSWVLDEAVRQTASWHRAGLDSLQVAVNVSASQFAEPDFVERVERTLAAHGLASRHLELEVTESVGMLDVDEVVERLGRLRALGVSIAIDDFGTDYSSLQYLETLPLDNLKIDRSFIVKLDAEDGRRSLAPTIVLMAKSLALKTVAEGVETPAQLERVVALGCDQVQGYYYSKPVPADEVPATIARIEATLQAGGRRAA